MLIATKREKAALVERKLPPLTFDRCNDTRYIWSISKATFAERFRDSRTQRPEVPTHRVTHKFDNGGRKKKIEKRGGGVEEGGAREGEESTMAITKRTSIQRHS